MDRVPSLQNSRTRARLVALLAEHLDWQLLPTDESRLDWQKKKRRLRSLSSQSLLECLTHPDCSTSERHKVFVIEAWLAVRGTNDDAPKEGKNWHLRLLKGRSYCSAYHLPAHLALFVSNMLGA